MKIFLSIGSGPGIGSATAERFAREGYYVILSSRNSTNLSQRVQLLTELGFKAEARAADAGNLSSISRLIDDVIEDFGTIDVLHFNCASVGGDSIPIINPIDFIDNLVVNIGAAFVAINSVYNNMARKKTGTIMITGGAYAIRPNPNFLSLSVGKSALRTLVHGISETFKHRNINIFIITIGTWVRPGSQESIDIAELLWKSHISKISDWKPEIFYPLEVYSQR